MRSTRYGTPGPARLFPVLVASLALLALPGSTRAQEAGTVTGEVIDGATRQPISGAQVVVEGTERGGLTNARGQFLIPGVPAGPHVVKVLYIGYRAESRQVTVSAGQPTQLRFELSVSVLALDEVVVTGTGVVTERRRLGQTIATVGTQQLEDAVASNVTEVLQGRIPGLVAHTAPGEVGGGSPIRLRGTVSLTQRNDPVLYVDGVRVDNSQSGVASVTTSRLNDINPADIERIEVIKGAAAATLFGTEASSGVIQIFTKRGRSGAPQYTVEVDEDFSRIAGGRIPRNYGYDPETGGVLSNEPSVDFLQTGRAHNVAVSVQGGSNETQYVLSGRYRREEGTLPTNGLDNWSFRTGLDHRLTEKLQLRFDANRIHNVVQAPNPNWGLVGEFVLANPTGVDEKRPYGELFYTIAGALGYQNELASETSTLSGKASYAWRPGINSELTVGYNKVDEERILAILKGAGIFYGTTGDRNLEDRLRSAITIDAKTSWQAEFGPELSSTFVIGGQSFWETDRTKTVGVRDFAAPGVETLRGGSTVYQVDEYEEEVINAGVFAQEQLGLWNRLFLTAGVRMDGNSAFGEDFGFQVYPKAGAAWVVSDHSFWSFNSFGWELLRLRAAYGTSGLQPGAFDAQRTWRAAAMTENQPVVRPLNPGNPKLKPERSVERELAAELGLFDGRVGVEVVYFNQKTVDALLPKQSAPSDGFLQAQLTNIGELESQGIEASLNWSVIRRPSFGWNVNATVAVLDQVVTDLGGVPAFRVSGTQRRYNSIAEGYQPGAVIAPITDPEDPYRLSVPIAEFTSLNQLSPNFLKNAAGGDSLAFIGNQAPTLTGSLATSFDLPRGLRLQAVLNGAAGFIMMNETELIRAAVNITQETAEMQKKLADPGTSVPERQEIAERYGRKHPRVISHWAEDADYLRLQEVSLSYDVPERFGRLLGADRVSVSVAGRNLLLFTRYGGIQDPGTSTSNQTFISNIDYFKAPLPRSLSVRVRANW